MGVLGRKSGRIEGVNLGKKVRPGQQSGCLVGAVGRLGQEGRRLWVAAQGHQGIRRSRQRRTARHRVGHLVLGPGDGRGRAISQGAHGHRQGIPFRRASAGPGDCQGLCRPAPAGQQVDQLLFVRLLLAGLLASFEEGDGLVQVSILRAEAVSLGSESRGRQDVARFWESQKSGGQGAVRTQEEGLPSGSVPDGPDGRRRKPWAISLPPGRGETEETEGNNSGRDDLPSSPSESLPVVMPLAGNGRLQPQRAGAISVINGQIHASRRRLFRPNTPDRCRIPTLPRPPGRGCR